VRSRAKTKTKKNRKTKTKIIVHKTTQDRIDKIG
jgi:hypothetical protein